MKISIGEPQVNSAGKYKVDKWIFDAIKRIVELKSWHKESELVKLLGEITPIQQRTGQQNRALHLFLTRLAETLNLAGLEMKLVLKADTDIWWTMESCKSYLWKPIQKAVCGTDSTTELEKQVDIEKVHETLMRHLGEKFHVEFIPFPSEEKKEVKEEVKEVEYPEYEGPTAFD